MCDHAMSSLVSSGGRVGLRSLNYHSVNILCPGDLLGTNRQEFSSARQNYALTACLDLT